MCRDVPGCRGSLGTECQMTDLSHARNGGGDAGWIGRSRVALSIAKPISCSDCIGTMKPRGYFLDHGDRLAFFCLGLFLILPCRAFAQDNWALLGEPGERSALVGPPMWVAVLVLVVMIVWFAYSIGLRGFISMGILVVTFYGAIGVLFAAGSNNLLALAGGAVSVWIVSSILKRSPLSNDKSDDS